MTCPFLVAAFDTGGGGALSGEVLLGGEQGGGREGLRGRGTGRVNLGLIIFGLSLSLSL